MRIERVDDKTVKCFLTNEELEEYDISYKDFVTRSDKAKEVVEEIIEQAEEEVGYQPPRFAFDLQIMLLPEEGMVLTFSEKAPGEESKGKELLDCLKEMKTILEERKQKMFTVRAENTAPELPDAKKAEMDEQARPEQERADSGVRNPELPPESAVFYFKTLRDVCDYAASLPKGIRVRSSLYEMDGLFYLYLHKYRASYANYNRACIQALEFGGLYAVDGQRVSSLEEHGSCVVEKAALRKLSLR